ncbi:type VI secretion system tip protein TssI/VgrG [Phycisphaeraceae bacterium D3-23]
MADYTQENRRLAINTPLGVDVLLLTDLEAEEELSKLFSIQVKMISEQDEVAPADLVGQNVTVSCLDADDEPRYFNGYVREFSNQGHGDRGTIYTAHIVPGFWFLTRRRNCRMFQELSVVEILQEVFDTAGFSDYDLAGIQGSYDPLEYCVQYEETDFAFASRLMEEFGIFYFFTHEDGKHTLVLADSTSGYQPAKHDTARFAGPLSFDEVDDTLTAWAHRYEYRSGKVAVADFNFKLPEAPLQSNERTVVDLPGNKDHELYSYPGQYQERGQGDQVARVRMEAEEADHDRVDGASKLRSFAPGFTFSIEDHHQQAEVGKSYVLTKVYHTVNAGSYVSGGTTPEGYSNTFTCIPAEVPFRPQRTTPRARVEGPQTAIVVGPSGEEIYTDEFGRVKVKFHWDRTEQVDDTSSCWVRVSQTWAGRGWGAMHIPRIGQEVIVEFLEGNPDRPIITGRVYNGANGVPYELPANKTIAGMKTNSSPGGGGFNEFRFEDKKGEEQIFMHAQHNRDSRVLNDDYEWIGNDQHLVVKNNQIEQVELDRHTTIDQDDVEQIGRDRHLDVGGKEAKSVGDSHSFTVNGDVVEVFKGNQSTKVSNNVYIKAMGAVIEASSGITLKCGGNSVVIDASGVTIKGSALTLDGQAVRIASGPGSPAMSGMAGNAVSPAAPKTPEEADDADPGEVAEVKARQKAEGKGKYGVVPAPAFKPKESEDEDDEEQSWIEIELLDEEGNPVPGERYEITLPDGSVTGGTLDDKGQARAEGFDPGSCKVTFPELDQEAWDKA